MEDLILELAAVFASAAIGTAALYVRKWTGVQIEEKHQRALHEALMSGAAAAYSEGTEGLEMVIEKAIAHARVSVPDAMEALAPETNVLRRIARRQADQARPWDQLLGGLSE